MLTRSRAISLAGFLAILTLLGLWGLLRMRVVEEPISVALPLPKSERPPFPGHDESKASWLAELNVDFPIKFARRDILVRSHSGLERARLTKLDQPLFPELETVERKDDLDFQLQNRLEPLHLDVPAWPEQYPNASHVMFGVSTSLERLEISIPYFQRWLAFTHARLIAIVVGPDDVTLPREPMRDLEDRMRNLGIAATLVKPLRDEDRMEGRYFSLVKILAAHSDADTKWAGFIDDDTFYPSMTKLLAVLSRHDASKRQYLGALSEEWWTVGRYSLMGMGGAGSLISVPLLQVLDDHYQDCLDESRAGAGDMRLYECARWQGDTRLTHVNGMHQIDLHGDRSGLLESGRDIISLHHWKEGWWDEQNLGNFRPGRETWFPLDAMHLVADICGTCFLQRWQFGEETVFSNGYTIALYPTGALGNFESHRGLEKVEGTWQNPGQVDGSMNPGWDHYLGKVRPPLELEKDKIQYRFLDASAVGGGVRQYYHHFGLNGDLDSVIELFWVREEDYKG